VEADLSAEIKRRSKPRNRRLFCWQHRAK